MRATRNAAPANGVATIAAADPLNLIGIILPGERVPANSSKTISFSDGVPLEAVESRRRFESAVAV